VRHRGPKDWGEILTAGEVGQGLKGEVSGTSTRSLLGTHQGTSAKSVPHPSEAKELAEGQSRWRHGFKTESPKKEKGHVLGGGSWKKTQLVDRARKVPMSVGLGKEQGKSGCEDGGAQGINRRGTRDRKT